MEQSQQNFIQIIKTQVGVQENNQLRKQNEEILNKLRSENPSQFIQHLTLCLKDSDVQVRQFGACQLRKNLSNYSEECFENLWYKIDEDTKSMFKVNILASLEDESASNIRELLAETVGEVGGCLQDDKSHKELGNQWPEIPNIIWQLLESERDNMKQAGYIILSTTITFASRLFESHQKDMHTILEKGMQNPDFSVKCAAIDALGSFISSIQPKYVKNFADLLPQVLQQTTDLLEKDPDSGLECLEIVADIAETEAKFFKKDFDLFFKTMEAIVISKKMESNVKDVALQATVALLEKIPTIIRNSNDYKKRLIEMIFLQMIDIDIEVDGKWQKPPEGFIECIEDDDDFSQTNAGMNNIEQLISSVGDKEMLPTISQVVQQMLEQQDWRYVYTAIMALASVGEYINDISDITPITIVVLKFFKHPNPKVRFAAAHTIGQISISDLSPEFQQKFKNIVMPELLQMLGDPVPRVQSHVLSALGNFLDYSNKEVVKPYIEETLQKCLLLLQNSISLVKEDAVSCIASLAEAAQELFDKYFQECYQFLIKLFNSHTTKEYNQLKGQIIEAIAVLGVSVSKELFKPHLTEYINLLVFIQERITDEHDPQKNFLLSSYERICRNYGDEIAPMLPQIIPSLFKLIKFIISNDHSLSMHHESDEDHTTGKTFFQNECVTAITMLNVFIDTLKDKYAPYVIETTYIILPLCTGSKNQQIKDEAIKTLPCLLAAIKKDKQNSCELVKLFISKLYEQADFEFEADLIDQNISIMKECIQTIGEPFLSQEEFTQLSQNIIKLLLAQEKRKQQHMQDCQENDELDDHEKELQELENFDEEELTVSIAELIGILFKTHKSLCVELVNYVYSQFLPVSLSDTAPPKMKKFGVFLVDDMVEYLGFDFCSDKWLQLANYLLKNCVSQINYLRQAASYGLGIFCQVTPKQQFAQFATSIYQALCNASLIPKQDSEQSKTYDICRDNITSALGKLIFYQNESIDVKESIKTWLKLLPIELDKSEAIFNHNLLLDLALKSNQLLFQNEECIVQVIHCYAKIIETKLINEEITQKIILSLKQMLQQDYIKNSWNGILRGLGDKKKTQFLEFIQSKCQQ